MSADLDALRTREWHVVVGTKWGFQAAKGDQHVTVARQPLDDTAEAMLLAACDRADAGRNPEEGRCDRCGRAYSVWYAPSEVWNAVVRLPGGEDEYPFLCPSCFIELAAVSEFDEELWRVAPDRLPTERERVLEEALSRAASAVEHAMNLAETPQDGDYYRDALRAARAALNPTREGE